MRRYLSQYFKSLHRAENLNAHVIVAALSSFSMQIVFAVLSFLNAVVIARILGAEGYGLFSNAMAWATVLVVPATYGLGTLQVRDIPTQLSSGNWSEIRRLLSFSDRFVLVLFDFLHNLRTQFLKNPS